MKMDKLWILFFVIAAGILYISASAFAQALSEECLDCSVCETFEELKQDCIDVYNMCVTSNLPDDLCDKISEYCGGIENTITKCRNICIDNCDEQETCVDGAPDGNCDPGENCPADASACDDTKCYEPTCTNGCGETPVPESTTDEACGPNGGCANPPCSCDGNGNCIESEAEIIDCKEEYGSNYWCSTYDEWQMECEGNGEAIKLVNSICLYDPTETVKDHCSTCYEPEPECHDHTDPAWMIDDDYKVKVLEKGCEKPRGSGLPYTEYLIEIREGPHCGEQLWIWTHGDYSIEIEAGKCYSILKRTWDDIGYVIKHIPDEITCPECEPSTDCHPHEDPSWINGNHKIKILEKGCTEANGCSEPMQSSTLSTEYLVEVRDDDHCGEKLWLWLDSSMTPNQPEAGKCYNSFIMKYTGDCNAYVIRYLYNEVDCPECEQTPPCVRTACEYANTNLPCMCGSKEATANMPWCCAADSNVYPTEHDCITSPSCHDEQCKIIITFDKGENQFLLGKSGIISDKTEYCPGDSIVITIEFLEDGKHVDYTKISAILKKPANVEIDLFKYLKKISTGIYEIKGGVGSAGVRTLEVKATFGDCKDVVNASQYTVLSKDNPKCAGGEEKECDIITTFDKEYYCEEDRIEITTEFRNKGVLSDPTRYGAMMDTINGITDITDDYDQISTGVYVFNGSVDNEGHHSLYLSAYFDGCHVSKTEEFFVYSKEECPTRPTCTDSDATTEHPDGKNYYVKGYATTDNGHTKHQDSCTHDETTGTYTLHETYCENNEIKTEAYKCPNGCKYGACVSEKVTINNFRLEDGYYLFDIYFIFNDFYIDSVKVDDVELTPSGGSAVHTLYKMPCKEGKLLEAISINPTSKIVTTASHDISNYSCGTSQCTDTDWFGSGDEAHLKRLATKGTCTDSTGTHEDVCLDDNALRDYYCGPLMQEPKHCLGGGTTYYCKSYGFNGCKDGACIRDEYDPFSSNTIIVYGAQASAPDYTYCLGELKAKYPDHAIKQDDDVNAVDKQTKNLILLGGPAINRLVADIASVGKTPTVAEWIDEYQDCYIVQIIEDAYTVGKDVLIIAGWDVVQSKNACNHFLENKAPTPKTCVGEEEPNCTDTDGGENIYTKGTVKGTNGDATDCCAVQTSENPRPSCSKVVTGKDEGNSVWEYACKDNGEIIGRLYDCSNGCKDGACIKEAEHGYDVCNNNVGWSEPKSSAEECGWLPGEKGYIKDCCCCYLTSHIHDLGDTFNANSRVEIEYMPGFTKGCTSAMNVYSSEDGKTWNLFYTAEVTQETWSPKTTYKETLTVPGDFRYIKINIPKCYNDYSSARVLAEGEEPSCKITSAYIDTECDDGSSNCKAGESIHFGVYYNGGDCPSESDMYVLIDALSADESCRISYVGGDMSGIYSGNSGSTGVWTIPPIPDKCKGKKITPTLVGLYSGGPPGTGKGLDWSDAVTRSFGFAGDSETPEEDECSTCKCFGADYKKVTCNDVTVYIDCSNSKCWTPTKSHLMPHSNAVSLCENLNYGGFSDWTLPDVNTLLNLCYSDACSGTCFDGDGSSDEYYWAYNPSSTYKKGVEFEYCKASYLFSTDYKNVRCVR
ncbi:MAG: S-layer protein [archaeon]|nr:S-layer protein [archaeon]